MSKLVRLARQLTIATRIHRYCRPLALQEVHRWAEQAAAMPDQALCQQAILSLTRKRFHCEGGAVYAAVTPSPGSVIPAICALQTLVDYLDNLSDRYGAPSEACLRQLHLAVDHALTPGASLADYYGPAAGQDGGYLTALVRESQTRLQALSGYRGELAAAVRQLGRLYADLQVYKHLPDRGTREARLVAWLQPLQACNAGWHWWELAAACGSTLGIFALLGAATRPEGERWVAALLQGYFPWIAGLHILLDYYIDQAEDLTGGDLNFVRYYGDQASATAGLQRILAGSLQRARQMPQSELHELVVAGLPGLYLSDPKVRQQRLQGHARRMVRAAGLWGKAAWYYCHLHPPGR